METIVPDGLAVSPALEALGLALSPVEAGALVVLAIAVVVAASTYRRHSGPALTLNERNVRDAGLTVEEARR